MPSSYSQSGHLSSSGSSYRSQDGASSCTSATTFTSSASQYHQAPVPSPSSSQPNQSFAASFASSHPAQLSHQGQRVTSTPPATSRGDSERTTTNSQQQGYQGSNPSATTAFLQDFNLVAEAAKRAQMAVLMRDMEGVAL